MEGSVLDSRRSKVSLYFNADKYEEFYIPISNCILVISQDAL